MNDLRAETFVSVCSVVEENERLKEEIACLKYRVKVLEDALRVIAEDETDYPRTVAKEAMEAACQK